MIEHMNSLTNAMVVRDTEAMLRFVDAQPHADASRVGAVGYCMSGPFVMAAARRTASSGIRAPSTASCFRAAKASTTSPPPSGTGNACSTCSGARYTVDSRCARRKGIGWLFNLCG